MRPRGRPPTLAPSGGGPLGAGLPRVGRASVRRGPFGAHALLVVVLLLLVGLERGRGRLGVVRRRNGECGARRLRPGGGLALAGALLDRGDAALLGQVRADRRACLRQECQGGLFGIQLQDGKGNHQNGGCELAVQRGANRSHGSLTNTISGEDTYTWGCKSMRKDKQ